MTFYPLSEIDLKNMKMTGLILCFGKTKKMPAAADIFDWFHFLYLFAFLFTLIIITSECICIVKTIQE